MATFIFQTNFKMSLFHYVLDLSSLVGAVAVCTMMAVGAMMTVPITLLGRKTENYNKK